MHLLQIGRKGATSCQRLRTLSHNRHIKSAIPDPLTCCLQTRSTLHEATAPGNEAVGWTFAADSGFVVRADALRTARWLPEHSETLGHALGKELLRCGAAVFPY